MKAMILGRYERRDELATWIPDLQHLGYQANIRWLDPDNGVFADMKGSKFGPLGFTEESIPRAIVAAEMDLEDLLQSDLVVAVSDHPDTSAPRGNRHFELGVVFGISMLERILEPVLGKVNPRRMVVVGFRELNYHCLPGLEFYPSRAEFVDQLGREKVRASLAIDTPRLILP